MGVVSLRRLVLSDPSALVDDVMTSPATTVRVTDPAERAANVVRALEADGVPANHLVAAGYGDTQPLDPANTPAAYAKNRRVEFSITQR